MAVNYSCVRIKQYSSSTVGACWRHVERRNDNYGNVNVDKCRIPLNFHYKEPSGTYSEMLEKKVASGEVSLRGLREDAKTFDEMVVDINSRYFEERGGYDFAKDFYGHVFRFAQKIYGKENILSSVLHADEQNKALTEEYGYPVYHYHIHIVALPVVEKEILFSKRCKDPSLVGTVKEVQHQVSHSKKWASQKAVGKDGKQLRTKNGKPKLIPSYRILQSEFVTYMRAQGYDDFERGQMGSTTEHLECLDYQIKQDRERLQNMKNELKIEQIHRTVSDLDQKEAERFESIGKRTLTGKIQLEKSDFDRLTELSKEAIESRREIRQLTVLCEEIKKQYERTKNRLEATEALYEKLKETCKFFLYALERLPELVRRFVKIVVNAMKQEEKEYGKRNDRSDFDR